MNFLYKFAILLTLTQLIQCLPFPFELGGDREEEDVYYPSPAPTSKWGYYQPSSRSMMISQPTSYQAPSSSAFMMMSPSTAYQQGPTSYSPPIRRTPFSRRPFSRFRNGRTAQANEDEDEKNREKVAQAIQAQQAVIDTVLPIVNSIVPATAGFMGMMPRMRRSHGSSADDAPDQLSMPSESSLSVIMPVKEMNQPSESVAPSVVVPINYQQAAAMMAAQERSGSMEPVSISVVSGKDDSESEDKNDDDDDSENDESFGKQSESRASGLSLMSLPQIVPSSFLPHPPDATVTMGDDDKIYFAIDRKTILTFLGALFGGDMNVALASAMHENSVHKA